MIDFTPLIIFGSIAILLLSISVFLISVAKFNSCMVDKEAKQFELDRLKYGKKD